MDQEIQKQMMLDTAKLILNSKNEVIQILKKTAVSQIQTIDRNSKSLKDPDPLSSMLSNISLKYPITLERNAIALFKIPDKYYLPIDDLRKYNRVPARLEVVDWYIEEAEVPDRETKNIIDAILQNGLKRLNVINSMKWESIEFNMGNVNISRKMVSTNPLDLSIPKEYKNIILSKILNIENFVDYEPVPEYMFEFVREILLESNQVPMRSIPNLIHFLSSQLDERKRFLPVVPGLNENFLWISHVMVQPKYIAKNIGEFIEVGHRKNELISDICIKILAVCKKLGQYNIFLRIINNTTVGGFPAIDLLKNSYENTYIRAGKALCGFPVSSYVEMGKMVFRPQKNTFLKVEKRRNKDGLYYSVYLGTEKVYFQSSCTKGYFTHTGTVINKIHINVCQLKMIEDCLGHIAAFCCKDFEQISGLTYSLLQQKAINWWTKKPHQVIGATEEQYRNWRAKYFANNETGHIGNLVITENIDDIESVEEVLQFYVGENVFKSKNDQFFMSMPEVRCQGTLDAKVDTMAPELYRYLDPRVILIKRIREYFHDIAIILNRIRNERWETNDCIINHVVLRTQNNVVLKAREICSSLVGSTGEALFYIAALYGFTCSSKPLPKRKIEIEKFRFSDMFIFFNLNNGHLKIEIDDNKILLRLDNKTVLISVNKGSDIPFVFKGLADNIKLIYSTRQEALKGHLIPYFRIMEDADKYPEGYTVYTQIDNNYFKATKDNNFGLSYFNTIMHRIGLKISGGDVEQIADYLDRNRRRRLEIETDANNRMETESQYTRTS